VATDKSYESQPDGRDDEYGSSDEGQEVTGHASVLYSCNSRENLLKSEVGSGEVSEHGTLPTTEGRGTEAAPLLSTSSSATADMSDGINNEHLTERPMCSICIEEFQRDREYREGHHNYSESTSSDTELPRHTPTAEVQRTVGTDNKSYESQPDGRDDEYGSSDEGQEVTGHASVLYSCNSRENLLKSEVGSEEVASVSEHGALPTTEGRGTEAAPLLSTSSSGTADMSDGIKNKHLTERPMCSICIEELITQQVGTTDTCNHKFCAACLQEWSTHANTCPVDRQTFNFVLVQHHVNGEIITRIPVEPTTQRFQIEDDNLLNLIFCQVCREPDRENWILLCDCCGSGYHTDCLDPPLDTAPLAEWFCPDCDELN
jgi:hypothetical protein